MSSALYLCPFFDSRQGLVVLWEITLDCNLRCHHCLREGGDGNHFVGNISDYIDFLCGIDARKVLITGGEPLIHPQILKIIHLLSEAGLSPELYTNGILINQEIGTYLKDVGLTYVTMSLDGSNASVHESIRVGQPSFRKVCSAAEILRSQDIDIDFTMTVGRHNAHDVSQVVLLAETLGAKNLSITPILPIGRSSSIEKSFLLDPKTLHQIADDVSEIAEPLESLHVERIRFPRLRETTIFNSPCSIFSQVYLGANMEVGLCPWMASGGLGVTHIDSTDIGRSYEKIYKEVVTLLSTRDFHRGCPLAAFLSGRGIDGQDPLLDEVKI
jgi:MoaA/NifB/PqqE/SkfB family radical SAM enzyme